MFDLRHFTVHEADVAFHAAWRDGFVVSGPSPRHCSGGLVEAFRAGLTISQVEAGDGGGGSFGEWRKHGGNCEPGQDGWLVEMKLPLAAGSDEGEQVSSWPDAGAPLVVVVRFLDKDTGWFRVFQFHDAVLMPVDAVDDAENMMRTIRISAGWMEERYHGEVVPGMDPVVRGVIEWRHAGKRVRAWEYDDFTDEWTECGENVFQVEGEDVRYVSLGFSGEEVQVNYMAAATKPQAKAGGVPVFVVGWGDVGAFRVESSGLTLWPGWTLETEGAAEPLAMVPSGRHWEHPKVVLRVLGRIYASFSHGVVAMPKLSEGLPEGMIDLPIRLGRLVLLPDGGWMMAENWMEEVLPPGMIISGDLTPDATGYIPEGELDGNGNRQWHTTDPTTSFPARWIRWIDPLEIGFGHWHIQYYTSAVDASVWRSAITDLVTTPTPDLATGWSVTFAIGGGSLATGIPNVEEL